MRHCWGLRIMGVCLSVVAAGLGIFGVFATSAWASSSAGGYGDVPLNWWQWSHSHPPLGWFLLDFFLFLAVLLLVTRKPLGQALAQRHVTIKRSIAQAAEALKRAKERAAQILAKLSGVDQQIKELKEANQRDGILERDRMVEQAESFARRLENELVRLKQQEFQKAEARLHTNAARRAILCARKLLQEQMTSEDQRRLLDEAIGQLAGGQT